jgi:alpha-acetolactate decarboxylase
MRSTTLFICQLPQEVQDEIVKECKKVFENLAYEVNIEEEIQNVKYFLKQCQQHQNEKMVKEVNIIPEHESSVWDTFRKVTPLN